MTLKKHLLSISHVIFITLSLCFLPNNHSYAQSERIWIPGWQETHPLATARAGAAVVETGNHIYVIGGVDGRHFLRSVEQTHLEDTGGITAWSPSQPLNVARGFFAAAVHNGYIYAVGGGNGPSGHNLLRSVERAKLLPNGQLGPWQTSPSNMNIPRRCAKVAIFNNRIYAFGGFGGTLLDTIESAAINADGSLGAWRIENKKHLLPRYVHSVKKTTKALFVLGGHNEEQGTGLSDITWSPLQPDTLLNWQAAPSLNTGRYALNSFYYKNWLYVAGGLDNINYLRSIEKTTLSPTTHEISTPWTESNPLASPRANFGVVQHQDAVYIIGGTNSIGYYNTVEVAYFNKHGDLGFWGTKQQAHEYESQELSARKTATVTVPLPHHGKIIEIIDAGSYSYIHAQSKDGEEWLAAGRDHYQIDMDIRYSDGVLMPNFQSKTLKRHFKSIRFVSRVEIIKPDSASDSSQ